VDDGRPLAARQCRDPSAQREVEARQSTESRHWNPNRSSLASPRTVRIEAAHRGRYLRAEPPTEIDDEPLGAARREAQDNVQDA